MKKTILSFLLALLTVWLWAAPEPYVTKSASGTTAAAVYFEPGPTAAALVVADVTSDKAASLLSWRTGTNQLTLLAPAAADVTNLLTTVGNIVSNTALVSVTAAGVVTPHNGFTNSLKTNALIYLENPIGTNLTSTSLAKKLTGAQLTLLSTSSTNVITIASNLNVVVVGTNFLFQGSPGQVETNQVASWVTNGANFDVTLSNSFSFTPQRILIMTNTYHVMFAALATDFSLILSNSTGLAAADQLVMLPSTGGASVRQINAVAAYRYQSTNLKAVTGLVLAAGDRLFVLDADVTTPLGAATLRLLGDPVRYLPANMPGVLSVDGTSACAINAAVVRYR